MTRKQILGRSFRQGPPDGGDTSSTGGERSDAELRAKLESTRTTFHSALASLSEDDLRRRSANPGWSNAELLFHAALGIIMVPPLVRIVGLWGRLPRGWSRRFASVLDASTPLFDRVNGLGPRVGARIYRGASLSAKFDRASAKIARRLDATNPRELGLGMYFPRRWYPQFSEYLTVRELYLSMFEHTSAHIADLRLAAPAPTP